MSEQPEIDFDERFSQPEASSIPWNTTVHTLEGAELYWLSTVRPSGEPHVTPLVGVWFDDAMYFSTGADEQKAINLETNSNISVTTGVNTWNAGTDVVIEGTATRVTQPDELQTAADAYLDKYGEDWRFDVGDGVFVSGDGSALVFRVKPSKVLTFAKDPHGQTRYRF